MRAQQVNPTAQAPAGAPPPPVASMPVAMALPPAAASHALPPAATPDAVLDQVARALTDDSFIETVIDMGLVSLKVVALHASAMKFVARADPGRAAHWRALFEDCYAKTAFGKSGQAGAAFDAAAPADVPYVAFFACFHGLTRDENRCLRDAIGSCTTLVGQATKEAFKLLAPGGLDEATLALACAIIRSDLVTLGGTLAYSEMDENPTINGREVEDNDIVAIQERFDLAYAPIIGGKKAAVLRNLVDKAVTKVAMERPVHDVRRYLQELPPWDGTRRLKYIVRDLLRAELEGEVLREALAAAEDKQGRREIVRRIGLARKMFRKLFIAGVARTLKPGCKHDSVLILKGKQGRMKSTFFRTITPCGRFSDNDMELKDKDSKLELRKAFIFEWSELSTVRSAKDWETVKGFLARQEDVVRPPYARRAMVRKRHCLIVGTTNESEFLDDSTGSRRFWVIETGDQKADLKKTEEQRDQLWAEALHLYRGGATWWFEGTADELREKVNDQHTVDDPWAMAVEDCMNGLTKEQRKPGPSSEQVLVWALKLEPVKATKADVRHVGRVLRSLGYKSVPAWDPRLKKSYKAWTKPELLSKNEGGEQ